MCKIITKIPALHHTNVYICSVIKNKDIMKTLIKRIDRLIEQIEMGFLPKKQAMFQIRKFRSDITDKFDNDSDEFMQCMECLIDANSIANEL